MKHFGVREGGSHQKVLMYAVGRTTKPILELGMGESSTKQLHDGTKNKIVSIENDAAWFGRYFYLEDENHLFLLMSESKLFNFFTADKTDWGVVFVDWAGGNWAGRRKAIEELKDRTEFMVVHDTEYAAQMNYFGRVIDGKRNFGEKFRYWIEFQPEGMTDVPATVLGSNTINLKDIVIPGMVKLNQSL